MMILLSFGSCDKFVKGKEILTALKLNLKIYTDSFLMKNFPLTRKQKQSCINFPEFNVLV